MVPIFTPEGELFIHGLFPDIYRLDSFLHYKERSRDRLDALSLAALLRDEFDYTVRSAWYCISGFAGLADHQAALIQSTPMGTYFTVGPDGSLSGRVKSGHTWTGQNRPTGDRVETVRFYPAAS